MPLTLKDLERIVKASEKEYELKVLDYVFIGSNLPPNFSTRADIDLVCIVEKSTNSNSNKFKQYIIDAIWKKKIFLDLIIIDQAWFKNQNTTNNFLWYILNEQGKSQTKYFKNTPLNDKQRDFAFSLKIKSLKSCYKETNYKNLLTLSIYLFLLNEGIPYPPVLGKKELYNYFKELNIGNSKNYSMIKSYITLKENLASPALFESHTSTHLPIFSKLEIFINTNIENKV